MEPVIKIVQEDDEPSHGTPGAGPGFVGEPPKRPHGKTASPEAVAEGGSAKKRKPLGARAATTRARTAPRPV